MPAVFKSTMLQLTANEGGVIAGGNYYGMDTGTLKAILGATKTDQPAASGLASPLLVIGLALSVVLFLTGRG